ncbi:hypothetical protein [Sporosarcina beigongshangi]|uniref:hypothetical protein n=1 Tax=Sporosarcina beigongshangi TaxID=2782538 RepID=UPI002ACD48BA|nr:hypothetical protein [Sporosarcina beigongshangi]
MMRDILRTLGASCILAGGILYFTPDNQEAANPDALQFKEEISKLKSELAKTKEELAIAQTKSSTEKTDDKVEPEVVEGDEDLNEQILIIESGSTSTLVAATLESLGIIQDAKAFDDYLSDNGLAGKIQIGEYQLDSSMDLQTIAKKITK